VARWLPANRQPSADRQGFQSEAYLATIRNFRRYSWLLMYLFGASPVLQRLPARPPHKLDTLSDDTLYLPYATSLRMSDLGYQNDAQSGLSPHENCLDSYVAARPRPSTSRMHRMPRWAPSAMANGYS
jgi:gamma-glutamylcysteine synthetase